MPTVRTFFWSRFAVIALLSSTAALAVAGSFAWFLDVGPATNAILRTVCVVAFAFACGSSLAVAQAAAAAAQTLAASKTPRPWALGLAIFCAGLTGLVSVAGVHLGWSVLAGEPQAMPSIWLVDLAGLGLAFVKQAMGFVLEACVEVDRAAAKIETETGEDRAERRAAAIRAHERELAELRARANPGTEPVREPGTEPIREPRPSRARRALRVVGATAAAATLALSAGGSQAQANPTEPVAQTQTRTAAEVRAEARARLARGESKRAISRETGVPLGTLKRWGADLNRAAA